MRKIALSLAAASLVLLAGCDTTSPVVPYAPSTSNALALQAAMKATGSTVSVGAFTLAGGVESPGCRLVGALDVTAGKPLDVYLHDALQTELFTAGVYDTTSPVVITGRVEDLRVNTFLNGSWTITVRIASSRYPAGYSVQVTHNFSTSYLAESACHNATNAFAPTVQELIGQIVSNPEFAKLIGVGSSSTQAQQKVVAAPLPDDSGGGSRMAGFVAVSQPAVAASPDYPMPSYVVSPLPSEIVRTASSPLSGSSADGRVIYMKVLPDQSVQEIREPSPR